MTEEKKDKIKEMVEKIWPVTKKELEKVMNNTKGLIDKGEAYLKDVEKKGAENVKKMSLSVKKEGMYYNLGKLIANTPRAKWSKTKKIGELLTKIDNLDKEIKNIK